jgi:hypothetical protein
MIKVEIEYKGRTKIINAAHIDIKEENGVFDIYVLDVAGEEHRENSANEELEVIYVDEERKYNRRPII